MARDIFEKLYRFTIVYRYAIVLFCLFCPLALTSGRYKNTVYPSAEKSRSCCRPFFHWTVPFAFIYISRRVRPTKQLFPFFVTLVNAVYTARFRFYGSSIYELFSTRFVPSFSHTFRREIIRTKFVVTLVTYTYSVVLFSTFVR